MTSEMKPKQVDFTPISEEWGRAKLSDGSIIETRIILSDLTIYGEDLLGIRYATSTVVALRVKSPEELKDRVRDNPLTDPTKTIPLTEEAGFERIEVDSVEKPTESFYHFDGHTIVLKLEIRGVIRNLRFKVPSGSPLYHVRWTVNSEIKKTE